ncbi:MAG TPA: PLP-dependent aminotransferase family protein, partial [Erysipelotrichaceae bacterium]|nr:PLP-dependent aminotransferase family protein [Erysipelotrichaceae bacterium]
MKVEISRKMQSVQASAIREILKMTSNPDVISFAGGNPASDAFPVEDLKRISAELFEEDPIGLLQYGITEGDAGFLEAANKFFNREEQVTRAVDQIIATTGSQQIMDLLTKVLCNEGDVVACEEPAFLGALNSFKEDGAILRGVGFSEEG